MLDAPVPGKRRRGRQKIRCKDSCKTDMESVGLKRDDVLDKVEEVFKTIPPTPDDGNPENKNKNSILAITD